MRCVVPTERGSDELGEAAVAAGAGPGTGGGEDRGFPYLMMKAD